MRLLSFQCEVDRPESPSFKPQPKILQPFKEKKKNTALNDHSSTRPNGTIVQKENSSDGCVSCGRHIMKKMIDVF